MPACNVLFWNQVIQTNQFTFPALGPLISWFSGGRIFFVLRCTHFSFLCYQYSCQVSLDIGWERIPVIFVPQLEDFTQCIFYEIGHLPCRRGRSSGFILRPPPLIFIPTMLYFWAKPRRWRAIKKRSHHSLKSPLCSCVSITLPPSS